MHKKQFNNGVLFSNANLLTVDTESLKAMLGCGRSTAIKIGEGANAKIKVGRTVIWNVAKIKKYLEEV